MFVVITLCLSNVLQVAAGGRETVEDLLALFTQVDKLVRALSPFCPVTLPLYLLSLYHFPQFSLDLTLLSILVGHVQVQALEAVQPEHWLPTPPQIPLDPLLSSQSSPSPAPAEEEEPSAAPTQTTAQSTGGAQDEYLQKFSEWLSNSAPDTYVGERVGFQGGLVEGTGVIALQDLKDGQQFMSVPRTMVRSI